MREITKDQILVEVDRFESALKSPGFPELSSTSSPSLLIGAIFVLAMKVGGGRWIITGRVAEVSYQHTSIFVTLQDDGVFRGSNSGTIHNLRGFFYDSYGPNGWVPDFTGGRIPEDVSCQIKFFLPSY